MPQITYQLEQLIDDIHQVTLEMTRTNKWLIDPDNWDEDKKEWIKGVPKLKQIAPVGMAFFTGKLDYRALKFPQMLFVMIFIQARPGDFRNSDLIQEWAETLKARLLGKDGKDE